MPSKRFAKFRGYHAYMRLSDYQTAIYPIIRPPFLEKRKRQLRKKPSTAFRLSKYNDNVHISGMSLIS